MSALLDEVDQEIESRRKASQVAEQDVVVNGNRNQQEEEQPSVKVLGMEMTASCEGGKKWSRPDSPVLPSSPPPTEPVEPPQEIFLEGALPAQSHLLVSDSATEAQKTNSEEDPAVVLAGKMTLSVISLDSSENGTDGSSNSSRKQDERSSSNVSEEIEKIETDIHLEDQNADIVEVQNILGSVDNSEKINLLNEIENDIKDINNRNKIHDEFEKLSEIESIGNKDIGVDLGDINQSIIKSTTTGSERRVVATEPVEIKKESIIIKKNTLEQESEKGISSKNIESTSDNTGEKAYIEKTESISQDLVQFRREKLDQEPLEKSPYKEIGKIAESRNAEPEKYVVNSEISNENTPEENESLLGKKLDIIPIEFSNKNLLVREKALMKEKAVENIEEFLVSDVYADENEKREISLTSINDEGNSATEISNNVTRELRNTDEDDIKNEEHYNQTILSHDPHIKLELENDTDTFNIGEIESSNTQRIEQLEPNVNISADEKTVEKLNEAIDITSEIKTKDNDTKSVERLIVPEEQDEEEIEYEYENSDDEVEDDEISNIERINDFSDQEHISRLNGDDQEQSKYGTTTSATLAENDISNEEDLENEDEEVIEEIIEYVTDDEDEVEEIVQPGQQNNIDYMNE